MEINLPKIKKNYKKTYFKINPVFYWKGIVLIFFILVIASFIFAYNLYTETNKENISLFTGNNRQVEKEKKEKIDKVLEFFSNREKKSIDIVNLPAPIVDPSI